MVRRLHGVPMGGVSLTLAGRHLRLCGTRSTTRAPATRVRSRDGNMDGVVYKRSRQPELAGNPRASKRLHLEPDRRNKSATDETSTYSSPDTVSNVPDTRLKSLDGLRGAAAVIVLIHHALLTFPSLAGAYYEGRSSDGFTWALTYTPLHLFWAGTEAVYLFFVLSGVVLVLPVTQSGRSFSWLQYYPRRLLRLYIPVIAAVAFGAALTLLSPRFQADGLGDWVNARPPSYTIEGAARDLTLVFGPSRVISPLWSLQWEVLFSLLLPAFVIFAVSLRRYWPIKTIAVLAAILAGATLDAPALFFLPIFAIGALVAVQWQAIAASSARMARKAWAWPLTLTLATLLVTSHWLIGGLSGQTPPKFVELLPVLGVAIYVIAAMTYEPARKLLETRVLAWTGRISFALYLVHEPLIIAARLLTYPLSPWLGLGISVPIAFVAASLFARYIEQPSHRFAKRTSAALVQRIQRSQEDGGLNHM